MKRYTIGIYSQGQQRGVLGIYPSTQAAMADAQELADKMAGRARVQIEPIPERHNHHLIPGERAKYSAPLVARDPTLRDERLTVVEVTPDGYTVTAEGFEDLPPAHVADREVVAADSTSRSWPGDNYEGTAPRRNPPPEITFDKMTTYDGVSESYMIVNGEYVGHISRERPLRLGATLRGLARDTTQPYQYRVEVNDQEIPIPDGASLRTVKKIMIEAYNKGTAPRSNPVKRAAWVTSPPGNFDSWQEYYEYKARILDRAISITERDIRKAREQGERDRAEAPGGLVAYRETLYRKRQRLVSEAEERGVTIPPIEDLRIAMIARTVRRNGRGRPGFSVPLVPADRIVSEWLRRGLRSPRISDRVAYYEQLDDDQIRSALAHIEQHHTDRYGDVPFWASQVISFLEEIEGTPRTRRNPPALDPRGGPSYGWLKYGLSTSSAGSPERYAYYDQLDDAQLRAAISMLKSQRSTRVRGGLGTKRPDLIQLLEAIQAERSA